MSGKFFDEDKQDLLKHGFSESDISYLETLDSSDKKELYLKVVELLNNDIKAEQIMDKIRNIVGKITNSDGSLKSPEEVKEVVVEPIEVKKTVFKPEPTVIPEPIKEPTVKVQEPVVVQEPIKEPTTVVQEPIKEPTIVLQEPVVIKESIEEEPVQTGGKTHKNKHQKHKKSKKYNKSKKRRKSIKGKKCKKNKKSKHNK